MRTSRYEITRGEVNVGSATVDYFSFGNGGKYFVILPGISLFPVTNSAEAVAEQYKIFAEESNYKVFLFDRKRNIEKDYSVNDMADDTAMAMEKLGIENACVFGASQGGMIGAVMAIKYPHLVGKLVIVSSCGKMKRDSSELFCRWSELARSDYDVEKGNIKFNRAMFEKIYSDNYRETYRGAFAELEKLGSREDFERIARLIDVCRTFDLFSLSDKIPCKTLVVCADGDRVFSPDDSREIAAHFGCELYIYAGYSHAVYDEAPDFAERIFKFFEK